MFLWDHLVLLFRSYRSDPLDRLILLIPSDQPYRLNRLIRLLRSDPLDRLILLIPSDQPYRLILSYRLVQLIRSHRLHPYSLSDLQVLWRRSFRSDRQIRFLLLIPLVRILLLRLFLPFLLSDRIDQLHRSCRLGRFHR